MTTTLKNIMKQIEIEINVDDDDIDNHHMLFKWNDENKKVDKIMNNEYKGDLNQMKKKSLLWIEEIKKIAKWKQGEMLWINTKTYGDGHFIAWWNTDVNCLGNSCADIIIEPTGYCVMRHFNHYSSNDDKENNITWKVMIRVDSVYNDNISKQISKMKNKKY